MNDWKGFPLEDDHWFVTSTSGVMGIVKDGEFVGGDPVRSFEIYRHKACSHGQFKAKLLVTGACNQRCYFCSAAADWDKAGLPLSDVLRVIDELAANGFFMLQLHGGDVSVRRDLPEILEHAAKRNIFCEFFTNGSGPVWKKNETFERIAKLPVPPLVHVSLLASDAETHDALAKYPGAFASALETTRRLKALGSSVGFAVAVTTESSSHLGRLAELARRMDCSMSANTDTFSEPGGLIDTAAYAPTPQQIMRARTDMLGDAQIELKQGNCTAGENSITIDHGGRVVGCERNTKASFGSILEEGLDAILGSERYTQYMQKFYRRPEVCKSCPKELANYCNWCPAIPFNYGIAQDRWVDEHCVSAMRKRLFWTGKADPVAGSRESAKRAFDVSPAPVKGVRLPIMA